MATAKGLPLGEDLSNLSIDEPPSYHQSSPPSTYSTRPIQIPATVIDFHAYRLPSSTISADHVALTSTEPSLSSNPSDLLTVINEQIALPPRPTIRIVGQHSEYGTEYGPDKTDFDLTLNGTGLLGDEGVLQVVEPFDRGGHEEKKLREGDQSASLSTWAKAFCEDVSQSKRCERSSPFIPSISVIVATLVLVADSGPTGIQADRMFF